jgi:hypothetical protein
LVVLTANEERYCETIRGKDHMLRKFLSEQVLSDEIDPAQWLAYLTTIKTIVGNINNDVGFLATLLVKRYLEDRFGITDFDAAGKPQGASGIDIEAQTSKGRKIVGELKTTKPYQPGFGAQQRSMILKDLARLATSQADYRFMFVTDPDAFATLCKPTWAARSRGVEIVDLVANQTFLCPTLIQGK